MRRVRVGLAQVNPTVGAIEANARMVVDWMARARLAGCDIVAFPELTLTGYPPEDLLFKPAFIEANLRALAEVSKQSRGMTVILGFVDKRDDIFNAAALLHDGAHAGTYHKQYLPNYGVFDENLVVADVDLDQVFRARLHDSRRRKEKLRSEPGAKRISLPPLAPKDKRKLPVREIEALDALEEVYRALVLGTRDYVTKNGFKRVVIGLSGGIDSSIVAAIAVEALGAANVTGVTMPSPYSSAGTRRDAVLLAKNLGIDLLRVPITRVLKAYKGALAGAFKGLKEDVTEENLQARIRGNYLMALSNKFGWLVLNTGNKSEISVGYTTLYGDMAGGFAVIKDCPKMLVYKLSEHANARAGRELIPKAVFTRPPSAELRLDQTDQDTLPPYAELDAILECYVEGDQSVADIVTRGFDASTVRRVIAMVDRNEYKRRQGAIGIKITPRAFGKDWRLPIVNKFRE